MSNGLEVMDDIEKSSTNLNLSFAFESFYRFSHYFATAHMILCINQTKLIFGLKTRLIR